MSESALPDIPGYKIIREIGRGSSSVKYLALQKSTAKQVAVTVLNQNLLRDKAAGDYYLSVVRTLSTVSHPNVLNIHEAGRAEDIYCLVTDFIEGGNLRDRAAKGIGTAEALGIVRALASGLVAIHATGFIHMDIKPEKILFREDGTPILGGAGMAGLVDPRVSTGNLGTPEYMAPWQGLGKTIDSRGDHYSLGIVLYEMLTGDVPYKGSDRYDIGYAHINHPVPTLPESLAPVLQPLMERLLAKDPNDRYRNGEELIAAIDALDLSSLPKAGLKTAPVKEPEKEPEEYRTVSSLTGIGAIGDDEELPDILSVPARPEQDEHDADEELLEAEILAAESEEEEDPVWKDHLSKLSEALSEDAEVSEDASEEAGPWKGTGEDDPLVILLDEDEGDAEDAAIPVDEDFQVPDPDDWRASLDNNDAADEVSGDDAEPFILELADQVEDDSEGSVYEIDESVLDEAELEEAEPLEPDKGADESATPPDTDEAGGDGDQDLDSTLNRYEEMLKDASEHAEKDFASDFSLEDLTGEAKGDEDAPLSPDGEFGLVDLPNGKEAAPTSGGTDDSEGQNELLGGLIALNDEKQTFQAPMDAPPVRPAGPTDEVFQNSPDKEEQAWPSTGDSEGTETFQYEETPKKRARRVPKKKAPRSGGTLRSIFRTLVFLLLLFALVGAGAFMYRDRPPVKGWIEKLEKTIPLQDWLDKLQKVVPLKDWFVKLSIVIPGPTPAAAEDAPLYQIDKRAKISGLLAAAEADMRDGRLSRPRGGSALYRYRAVLELDPRNAEAIKGIDSIMIRYIEMARKAIEDGKRERAVRFLDRADTVLPGWENVRALRLSLSGQGDSGASAGPAASKDPSMVFVQGGCFEMGCGPWMRGCSRGEKPAHKACLDDFTIGRFEVTQGQWEDLMGDNPSRFAGCDTCPVEQVAWHEVQEFIKRLNLRTRKKYRLPTDAEWEYAARSRGRRHVWAGTSLPEKLGDFAWYDENSRSRTHSVGEKMPNDLVIYDMSGNVFEWCQDFFADKYYSVSPEKNPTGPATGDVRTIRGGSWLDADTSLRTTFRSRRMPDFRQGSIGFRLASTP